MRTSTAFARFAVATFLAIAALRAAAYATTVLLVWNEPVDAFFLESQMVHLSWRVQTGRPLYPEWRDGPWVVNVFGPVYFWIVGGLGRAWDLDLDSLRRLGRATTAAACCGTALLVAFAVRAHGRWAMLAAGSFTLGSPLALGIGVMARGDALAEFLGMAGFLLALSRQPVALAAATLVAAALARQTAGLFLIVSLLALVVENRRRRALWLAAIFAALAATTIGLTIRSGARLLLSCLLLEGGSAWSTMQWRIVAWLSVTRGLDAWLFASVALWSWRRAPWLALLALLPAAAGLTMCAKIGSDANYFLPMRLAAGIVAGRMVAALMQPNAGERRAFGAMFAAATVAFAGMQWLPGVALRTDPAAREIVRRMAIEQAGAVRLAGADGRILSNVGMVQLKLRERALFVDSFLFKMLVNDGRMRPDRLVEWLRRREIPWVVLDTALDDPNYDANPFGLPRVVADAVRRYYEPAGAGLLHYYRPRKPSPE